MRLSDLVCERIYADGDDLVVTIQTQKDSSNREEISTFVRRQPYETKLVGSYGVVVYSLFNYVSSDTATKLLSSIKGKGPYRANPKQVETFLDQCASASDRVVDKVEPDVIVFPKSSSPLVSGFVGRIEKRHRGIRVVGDAFVKKALDASDVEPLVNTSHPDWRKFSEENPGEVEKLKKSLAKMVRDYGGHLELKKLYKPYLKFVKNFVEMRDAYEVLEAVLGKSVLVVDDVLSSGATMSEMVRQVAEMEPESVAGLTIFKHTTQSV